MYKTLKIQGNCTVFQTSFGVIYLNGNSLNDVIVPNLPKLDAYKEYPAKVFITIAIQDNTNKDLNISTEGYEIDKTNEKVETKTEGSNE